MIGGQLYPNGVAFYTDEIWVKAVRGPDKKIHVEVRRREILQRRLMKRFGSVCARLGFDDRDLSIVPHRRVYLAGLLFGFVGLGPVLSAQRMAARLVSDKQAD